MVGDGGGPMTGRWRMVAVAMALAGGVALGTVHGTGGGLAVAKTQQQVQQEIFDAIYRQLKAAAVPEQDMPKQIIGMEEIGAQKYRVHVAMNVGDGWFEASWDGRQWAVRGLNAPPG